MNTVYLILAVLSFVGGQIYLLARLRVIDLFLEHRQNEKTTIDDACTCGYPEDVIE